MDDKKELPATRSGLPIGQGQPLDSRMAMEQKLMEALRDAAQRVYDETGIRVDEARFTWADRQAIGDLTRHRVTKVVIRTTVTTTVKDHR